MAFQDRSYRACAILGAKTPLPWSAPAWASISRALEPLVIKARAAPAVRSTQLGGQAPRMKAISFGRLAFDTKSAAKWTHVRPGELASGVRSLFLATELWAPSWTACERDRMAPDVYFAMSSDGGPRGPGETRSFDSVSLLAVAADWESGATFDDVARQIGEAVDAVLVASQTRPWGRSTAGGFYTDAINDLAVTGLFVPGPRRQSAVSPALLRGDWTPLAPGA